jgi:hypothetical protein
MDDGDRGRHPRPPPTFQREDAVAVANAFVVAE